MKSKYNILPIVVLLASFCILPTIINIGIQNDSKVCICNIIEDEDEEDASTKKVEDALKSVDLYVASFEMPYLLREQSVRLYYFFQSEYNTLAITATTHPPELV